ncbi:hypothetical protein, partial [Reichenbachiella sp.]
MLAFTKSATQIFLVCILFAIDALAQQPEFNKLFTELESVVGKVETSKYTYEPQLLFEHTSVIKYS